MQVFSRRRMPAQAGDNPMSTELPPRMTRRQVAEFLRELGFPITSNQLNKYCSPSRNEGPRPVASWGRVHLYSPTDCLAWAEARLRPPSESSVAKNASGPCAPADRRKSAAQTP